MNSDQHSVRRHSPDFVISAGTQVVLRVNKPLGAGNGFRKPGAVGVITECPDRADGAYLVEFANGETVSAVFDELTLRRKEIEVELADCNTDYWHHVIFRCQVGSRAYGLDHANSDDDVRGFFLPPAHRHWSLYAVPEQLERIGDGVDEVFWELEKFIRLCLKANPNVLEVLFTPMVLQTNELAEELRAMRSAFLSKHIYKTYSGYVLSQFRRMKNRFEKTGDVKIKHAMHLVRLQLSGIHALRTGEILVDVGGNRELLMNIRAGNWSFEQVRRHAMGLDQEFQKAFDQTSLPEQPDFQRVNDFLIHARRSAIEMR